SICRPRRSCGPRRAGRHCLRLGSRGMTTYEGTAVSEEAPTFYVAEEHGHAEGATMLRFWIYLMSDTLIFAVLFATYGVLGRSYAAGPSPKDVFDLWFVALNTTILLFSSITYGLAMLEVERRRMGLTVLWLAVTGLFGAAFVTVELIEFS